MRFPLAIIITLLPLAPLSATVATWNGSWPPPSGSYNSGADGNVPFSAVVQESPPSITLNFHRPGAYAIYRKLRDGTDWGTALTTRSATGTTYTDTNVSVGVAYEYKAVRTNSTSINSAYPTGYLIAGIRVDRTAPRGRVALIVTNTIVNGLPAEYEAYRRDLGAEGWTVHTIPVAPAPDYNGNGNLHQPLRDAVMALHAAYPGELKHVIILGKAPVCRTGLGDGLRPDGHATSWVEASDAYFAEMNGDWKDVGNNNQTGANANIPGDGKFDHSNLQLWLGGLGSGQTVELGYGRMDTSFYQASELETMRMYLGKLARYRRAADDFQAGRRAVIRKGYDNVDETGWMVAGSLVGPCNVTTITNLADLPSDPAGRLDPDGLYTKLNGPFLFYFKGSTDLGKRDDGGRAVFLTGMQSHWGWWAEGNGGGQMVGRLGTDNYTLSVTWSIWGVRYLYHRLGMGGDMGDVMRTTINNNSSYGGFHSYATANNGNGDRNGRLWLNHMGDPTLRLFPVRPVRNLTATPSGAEGVTLAWTASDDTALEGVHVYRAPAATGPWTQLTPPGSPLAGTTFTDTPPTPGEWVYSVRAIKLETTPGGTYLNPSLGVLLTVQTGVAVQPLAIVTSSLPTANWDTGARIPLQATGGNPPYTWSVAGGSLPPGLSLSAEGVITGAPTRGGEGYQPVFQVTDFRGASAQLAYELGVTTRRTVELPASADASVRSNVSYGGYNFGLNNGLEIVRSHSAAPLYYDAFPYLRFVLPALAPGERLEGAQLRLTRGGGTTTATTTLSANLLADAADTWVEGTLGGSASTGSPLTYNNRPTTLNPAVTAATFRTAFTANQVVRLNLLPHCLETLNNDAARLLSLVLSTDTTSQMNFCSRENPPLAHPTLELEISHAPRITLARPLGAIAHLPASQGLVLGGAIDDTSATTQLWEKLAGPGGVSFANSGAVGTTATFSAPGRYTLRLTADDGTLVTRQIVRVRVLDAGATAREGLVLHYRLDESTGAAVADSAPDGVAHNGTINNTGSVTWVPGQFAGALNVGANDRYISTPDQATLDNTSRLSVALWVRPASASLDGNARGLVAKRAGANSQDAYTLYLQSGALYVRFNGTNATLNTAPILTAGVWTHLAAVYDGSQAGTAACVKVYVNGVETALTGTLETDATLPDSTASLLVGQMGGGTTNTYQGALDDVRIYRGRALSGEDILDLLAEHGAQDAPRITLTPPGDAPAAGTPFTLGGSVTDDALPSAVTQGWSKISGTPQVLFTPPTAVAHAPGPLGLRLTADDGAVATFRDLLLEISPAITGFAGWASGVTWPQGADFTAAGDVDGDGLGNFMECALGLDPLGADPAAYLPALGENSGRLAFTFTRDPALPTFVYEVQAADELTPGAWTTIARSASAQPTMEIGNGAYFIQETPDGDFIEVRVTDAQPITDAPHRFLRLNVTEP